MINDRTQLPQLSGELYLTDGGIETTLIFQQGFDLPYFAAFDLLKNEAGRMALREYFRTYLKLAQSLRANFILESPTWRANRDWAEKMRYTAYDLADANKFAIRMLTDLRDEYRSEESTIVISGCIGPRGDGYNASEMMHASDAEKYHSVQIETFSRTKADMVAAMTMTYLDEALGIANAARKHRMPVAISYTVETDGCLPSGMSLKEAIQTLDALTDCYPAYYMLNCAHPTHFANVLEEGSSWTSRIRGMRANASTKSHAELDEATELDDGNPGELGNEYRKLTTLLPNLNVLGGCCGTDHRHIEQIWKACTASPSEHATY